MFIYKQKKSTVRTAVRNRSVTGCWVRMFQKQIRPQKLFPQVEHLLWFSTQLHFVLSSILGCRIITDRRNICTNEQKEYLHK